MSAEKTNDRLEYERRVHAEMLDSFDEELEMEIDDDRMNELVAEAMTPGEETSDLGRSFYFKELFRLQGELVKLQDWVVHKKLKVVVLFEGRDAAGKGGVIKRITQRRSPPGECTSVVRFQTSTTRLAGKRTAKRLPTPGVLLMSSCAWWRFSECVTMARPRPVPPASRERPRSMR